MHSLLNVNASNFYALLIVLFKFVEYKWKNLPFPQNMTNRICANINDIFWRWTKMTVGWINLRGEKLLNFCFNFLCAYHWHIYFILRLKRSVLSSMAFTERRLFKKLLKWSKWTCKGDEREIKFQHVMALYSL